MGFSSKERVTGSTSKAEAKGELGKEHPRAHRLTLMMMLRESSLGRKMHTLRRSCMTRLLWKGSLFIVGSTAGLGWGQWAPHRQDGAASVPTGAIPVG